MGKWKQAALAVLTVLLLLLGGALPFLAAAVQDANQNDAVRYGDMDTLELTLRSEEQEPLDMFTKLLLLQTGETVELAENEVNAATHEELLALADRALAAYSSAGLLWEPGEMELMGYVPFFLYLPGRPEINAQMWMLEMLAPEGSQLNIVVDQETGTLVAMECDSLLYMEKLGYDQEAYATVLAKVYFSTLGLEPFAAESPYYDFGVSQLYYLQKEDYENVTVQVSVQSDSFWITAGFF